jgi:aldehyde:ferredoxin oxidoreductase
LAVFTVSGSIHPIYRTPHNSHTSVSTHRWHQTAATWVNTTRYCKYSQVLLMMGDIARNTYSLLGIIY